LRILGWIFVALAAVAAGADYMAAGSGAFRLRDVGEVWFLLHSESLQLAQPAVERHIAPALWDPYIVTLLTWPLALALLGIGVLFLLLSRLIFGKTVERIYPD
jgi:hypothetical protein